MLVQLVIGSRMAKVPSPIFVFHLMLLWQLLLACDTDYVLRGYQALSNHVVASISAVTSYEECKQRCAANSACYSINHYSTGVCELNDATHLSHPVDITPSVQYCAYGVSNARAMTMCSNQYCSDGDICIANGNRDYLCKECSSALGMQSGAITNSQITASSTYHDPNHDSWRARLNYGSAWVAGTAAAGQYLQVDFKVVKVISKLAIQGRGRYNQWTTKFSLKYSLDNLSWLDYKYGKYIKEFQGNIDMNSIVTHKLPLSIKARYVRVVALEWNGAISMRLEFYGCIM